MSGQKAKDFKFDKRASVYDRGFEGRASKRFYDLLIREVNLTGGEAVLDVGCGTGALLKRLSADCEIRGFGIDAEAHMIAEAVAKCPEMGFAVSRCEDMSFESRSFDVVIACMAYHHFGDKDGFAKEAARLLKPGGVLYIADPRFPVAVRIVLNGLFRRLRVAGEFMSAEEMAARFEGFGFKPLGCATSGYAQVVKLLRV